MADEDGGAAYDLGGTTESGLAYAPGIGSYDGGDSGGGGGYDVGGEGEDGGLFGASGSAPSGGAAGRTGMSFASATGDVTNEDIILSVPSFANEENRLLNERLIARNRELSRASADTLEHQERISVMQEHLKNVRLELANAQKVLEARAKEVKSENHLNMLAERSVGRMRQDIAALDARGATADTALAQVHASVHAGTERLDAFKKQMNWKQEELEKWAAAARAKEDDAMALDKYTRADEVLVKDRVRELERLNAAVLAKRKELEAEALEAAAKQVELDSLAEEFRAAHAERASLLDRWQESLAMIQRRDEEIARLTDKFADARLACAARRERLNESDKLLQRLMEENAELGRAIEGTNRAVGSARDSLMSWTARVGNLRDKVEGIQAEVQGAAAELVDKRAANDNYTASMEEKRRAVERAKAELEAMKARKADAAAAAKAVEAALADKEKYLAGEAARVDKVEKEVATLRESQFRATDTLAKLVEQEETLRNQIGGARRSKKNLEVRLRELDVQASKQAEHLYTAEFQIQQMERKIARAKGEVSEEEKTRLEVRIAELTGELEAARGTEKQLTVESKTVKQNLAAAIRTQTELTKKLSDVQGRIDEALLQTRSGEEALKRAVREKEEALVAHDLLKLEVRRLRDALSAKTEDVYVAENRAAQLTLSIEARKREIAAHKAVQRAQAKLAEEERHKLALDLAERTQAVGLLKTKYEALCAKFRPSDAGDDGEPKSQAYYLLKAAQKREEMQREGDELDLLIKKSEKEVRALAATLGYLNERNEVFRRAFAEAREGSDEVAVVQGLEAQAKEAQDTLFRKKRELAGLTSSIEANAAAAEEAGERAAAIGAQLAALEAQVERAGAERDAALHAMAQASARVAQARERHRQRRARAVGRPVSEPTPDELVFHAHGVKEAAASVLYTLGQLSRELPQLKPDLATLLAERNLRMPARPPSQAAGASSISLGPALASSQGSRAGAVATPSRQGAMGMAQLAPSPITVPGAAGGPGSVASGSALAAIRARPGSAGSAKSAHTAASGRSGTTGGGTRTVGGGGSVASGSRPPAGQGKGQGAAQSSASAGLELGLTGKPLAATGAGANVGGGLGPGGKPPAAGSRTASRA